MFEARFASRSTSSDDMGWLRVAVLCVLVILHKEGEKRRDRSSRQTSISCNKDENTSVGYSGVLTDRQSCSDLNPLGHRASRCMVSKLLRVCLHTVVVRSIR